MMSKKSHYKMVCPYCGEKTNSGHLVPPSFDEPSFLICASINKREQEQGIEKKGVEADWQDVEKKFNDAATEKEEWWKT